MIELTRADRPETRAFLANGAAGATARYHVGELGRDQAGNPALAALAELLRRAADEGLVHLVQRRVRFWRGARLVESGFRYLAVRRDVPPSRAAEIAAGLLDTLAARRAAQDHDQGRQWPWAPAEDAAIERDFPTRGAPGCHAAVVAAGAGRSLTAIRARARELGIVYRRPGRLRLLARKAPVLKGNEP